jgi:hypothetical protein
MRRLGAILAGLAITFGIKTFNKSSTAGEVRTHLVSLCERDAACESAVKIHFDACFDSAFEMGGRHTSSRLKGEELVKCINQRAGKSYFAYSAKQE